jgi:hypothetical protein
LFFADSSLLAVTQTILANIVWPALYLIGRLLSIWVISLSLLVEFFFVWKLLRLGAKRAILADVTMNLASAVLGLILIGFLGLVVILPFRSTFGMDAWIATFIVAVLVNACVESLVVSKWFKSNFAKRDFWLLVIANTLTMGIAFGSLYFFPIKD